MRTLFCAAAQTAIATRSIAAAARTGGRARAVAMTSTTIAAT